MKQVVAYVRVSTEGQTGEDKYGIEAQKKDIINYCKNNEMEIVDWFIDNISGVKEERPEMDRLLFGEDIKNPPYETVVVAKSDRVARDIEIYFYYKMLLRKKNVELVSVSEDFGKMGVFKEILEAFTLTVAKLERDNINKRTSSGRAVKASKGGYSGGAVPFGYVANKGNLEVNEKLRSVVIKIFEMRENGETLSGICDYVNSLGIKTNRGGRFNTSTIQMIVNNKKTYQGFYKYGKNGEWVQGLHEAILKGKG